LPAAQSEEPRPSSCLLSSGRPGIISVGVLLQHSHDKQQQQHGAQNTDGPNFPVAYATKRQIHSNTNTPTAIPIMYSTGKSFLVSVAVEFEGDVISKYEAFDVLLEFPLISMKLPFMTLNCMTVTEVLPRQSNVIGSHKDTYFR
jgi:hypothetical protein